MEFTESVERGWRVKSLWNDDYGVVKYTVELRRTAGSVTILWDSGKTTTEVWKCDVEWLP